MRNTQPWLSAVVWSGALMLVLSGVLQATFPRRMGPLPEGLRTPVLALELARSPLEIETMFGAPASEQRAIWVAQCDRGNLFDCVFLVVYGGFLFAAARTFLPQPLVRMAMGLSVLAACADAVENLCLLVITARLGSEYLQASHALIVATWVKWISIAACLTAISPALRARGRFGRVAGWIGASCLPVALVAAAWRGVTAEIMLLVITLAFTAIWIEALRARRAEPR